MASQVYYMSDRSTGPDTSLVAKMLAVFDAAGLGEMIKPYDIVAIKVHCGEYNNTGYLRPVYARALADKIKSLGGRPFVCDTTTLTYNPFPGRVTALDEMLTAERNGYNSGTLGCPFIVADGFFGTDDYRVDLPEGVIVKETYIAKAVAMADVMIALTHFKGHATGVFGGAIKNMGIGCQSKRGKYNIHQARHPEWGMNLSEFNPHLCIGRDCPQWQLCEDCCPYGLFRITDHTIEWRAEECVNCQSHMTVINCGVLNRPINNIDAAAAAMADGALAVVKTVGRDKVGFVNLAIDATPACDCAMWSDRPVVNNIGVFASRDPVAIDCACRDMVNQAAGVVGSRAHETGVLAPGVPKLSSAASTVGASDGLQINTGVRNGLGSADYKLVDCHVPDPSYFRYQYDPRPVGQKFGSLFKKDPIFPAQGFKRAEKVDLSTLR